MSLRLKHAKGKHVAGRAKHARDSAGRVHGFRLRPIVTMATVATVLAAWALLTTPGSASGAGSAPTITTVTPNVGPTGGIAHETSNFPVLPPESNGLDSINISPQNVGDLVILSMQLHVTNVSITSVSGGNTGNWQLAEAYTNDSNAGGTDELHYEVWWGVATRAGPSTVSISYSQSVASDPIELIADSFTSGSGLPWKVVAHGGASGASGTSAVWPSLMSDSLDADQLYWGASEEETASTPGSTAGFNYEETAMGNCFLYDAQLTQSTAYQPSCTVSPPAVSTEVGVIFALAGSETTNVTITGTNFAAGDTVSFGGLLATDVNVVSGTSITATAPRSPTVGTVDVVVTFNGQSSAKGTDDLFTFYSPFSPTVRSVSPNIGRGGGGTPVTVTGSNFTAATGVSFGGVPATGLDVTSDGSLNAVAPAGAGTVDVTVTTPGGTSATIGVDQFSYTPGPVVTAVSPSAGPTAGGTTVTVSGDRFNGATAVHFGVTAATGLDVASSTSLTAVAPPGTGTVDVTVTTPDGVSPVAAGDQFTYATTRSNTTVGGGYDMVGSDGGVFVFPPGSSGFYGSLPGLGVHVNNVVGIVPTATGKGYWLVGRDGGVFAFGDAGFIGSLPGLGVHVSDIVGIVPTATDNGYWLVGRDGGVFAFGDATFVQSLPGLNVHVNNIVGIAPSATGTGYWLVGSDGSVYALGAPYYGGAGGSASPLVGIAATHSGHGYWLVAANGKVSNFGDAASYSDLPSIGPGGQQHRLDRPHPRRGRLHVDR